MNCEAEPNEDTAGDDERDDSVAAVWGRKQQILFSDFLSKLNLQASRW